MEIKQVTVGALKEFLKDVPDHYTIIISKDGEGNVFSPLSSDVSFGHYKPENPLIGDFEFDDGDPSSIVLFPIS
jgi:hypothetical protein